MPQAEIPDRYDHYHIERRENGTLWELGRGAMGVTYKARDTRVGSLVALKLINAKLTDEPKIRARFLREPLATARLNHPNVAKVHYRGAVGETHFYAMEFIKGETLQDYIEVKGPLPWRSALQITLQVAGVLVAAAEHHLLHRDIKPANLMLARHDGQDEYEEGEAFSVKVIDFGLAKFLVSEDDNTASLTGVGPIGTPHFMSPEQIDPTSEEADARSDLYSLGATLWWMLAGTPPFIGAQNAVLIQHLSTSPPLAQLAERNVPPLVQALLGQLLAKDRNARPADAAELRRKIKECLNEAHLPAVSGIPPKAEEVSAYVATLVESTVDTFAATLVEPESHASSLGTMATLVGSPQRPVATTSPQPVLPPLVGNPSRVRHPASEPLLLLVQAKRWIEAAQWELGFLTDVPGRNSALSVVAAAQAKVGDFTGALQTAQSIKDGSKEISALSAIAIAAAKAGDFGVAENTIHQIAPGREKCYGYADIACALFTDPFDSDD